MCGVEVKGGSQRLPRAGKDWKGTLGGGVCQEVWGRHQDSLEE